MSSPIPVPPAASVGRSTTPSPQPPKASIFSPKLFNGPKVQRKSVFETPPPSYSHDNVQIMKQRFPSEGLRTSRKDGIDSHLSRFLLRIQVKHDEGTQDFFVHRDLLLARSRFFKGQTSESETLNSQSHCQTFELSNVRPATFATYTNLIYMKRLTTRGPGEWKWLCRLYILAERLQDIETKNTVIDGMFLYLREAIPVFPTTPVAKDPAHVDAQSLGCLYEHTPENSPARRLAVDFYAQTGRAEWLQADKGKYPAEFVWDVAIRLMQRRQPSSLFPLGSDGMSPSDYHETLITGEAHKDGSECRS